METTRNNRSIGEPLPAEQKRGRGRKDKAICKVLRGEHSMVLLEYHCSPRGWFRSLTLHCSGCGKKKFIWQPTDELLKKYGTLAESGNVLVC